MGRLRSPPHVAVLVATATGWGRQLIRGITNYARKHGPWRLWIEPRGQEERLRLPQGWAGQGIIARVSSHAMARHLAAAGVPVVNISGIELRGVNFPCVTSDLEAAGRLAAEHFMDRGLRHFAYCGLPHLRYVNRHYRAFAARLGEAGHACPAYETGTRARMAGGWLAQQKCLARWLKTLPKPVGILAWATSRGRQVVEACHAAGLSVPEQVLVLGGDDDELLSESCNPSLSGIALPATQIGHEAAALLDRLLQGRRPPAKPLLLTPSGIVTRQSTEILAIDNAELAQALRYIREHAAEPIRVAEVLREVAVSRRQLERYFEQVLGRSPGAEIRRLRLERAKELLARTDLPMPRVAAASGFGSPEYLACVLKAETGLSPLKYRNRARGR